MMNLALVAVKSRGVKHKRKLVHYSNIKLLKLLILK